MKYRLLLLTAAAFLLLSASAQAINGPQAVRHIRQYVDEDCHSYPGFICLGWEVTHCYKLSERKVRCAASQEYRHNGNWRECRFKVAAVEARNHSVVYLHFGQHVNCRF